MPTAHQFNRLPDASQKPQDARLAPLGELALGNSAETPTRGRPRPALRAETPVQSNGRANSAATSPSKAPRPRPREEADARPASR